MWREPRALITPHAANPGASQLPPLAALFEDNLRRFAAGEPLRGLIDLDATSKVATAPRPTLAWTSRNVWSSSWGRAHPQKA